MTRFVVSDWHFGHSNSWEKFKKSDGSPLRPFSSTEEMDETMIDRHNKKVSHNDTVYVLGDCVINKRHLDKIRRLNGRKILIMGNHDIFGFDKYIEAGFEQVHGVRVFVDQFILSHIPLHPDCITDRFKVNVHGHLHANEVTWKVEKWYSDGQPNGYEGTETVTEPDPRYLCVSVEHTNYEPLSFDEVEARVKERWDAAGYQPPEKAGWGNGSGPG